MSKTIKVRIAVGVSATGAWNAAGWRGGNDRAFAELAGEVYDGEDHAERVQIHYITAEVPVPESLEIDGAVEDEADE